MPAGGLWEASGGCSVVLNLNSFANGAKAYSASVLLVPKCFGQITAGFPGSLPSRSAWPHVVTGTFEVLESQGLTPQWLLLLRDSQAVP